MSDCVWFDVLPWPWFLILKTKKRPHFFEVRGWFFGTYVITQGICNKFIAMKISVGCMVFPLIASAATLNICQLFLFSLNVKCLPVPFIFIFFKFDFITHSNNSSIVVSFLSLYTHSVVFFEAFVPGKHQLAKGQLNSEWIYEVIVSPKMPTKDFPDFCPTKQTKIVALLGGFFGECR